MLTAVLPPGDDLSIISAVAGIGAALGPPIAIALFPRLPWREAAADGALAGSIIGSVGGVAIFVVRNLF